MILFPFFALSPFCWTISCAFSVIWVNPGEKGPLPQEGKHLRDLREDHQDIALAGLSLNHSLN